MFNSGQKVSLGGFQFLLVELFRIEHSSLSKNRAILGESTHYSKCREQKKKKKERKEISILDIIFWNFSIFQHTFHSPQVKGYLISSITNIAYEVPHELPIDLIKTSKLGGEEPSGQYSFQMKKQLSTFSFCPVLLHFFTLFQ